MTLFWQHFKAQFAGLLVWVVSAGLLVLAISGSASTMGTGAILTYLDRMPVYIQKMMGLRAGMSPLDSYIGMEMSWIGILLTIYAVLLALTVISREVDRRTIDFVLALPVRRSQLVLARTAVGLVNTGVLTLAMWGMLTSGLLYYKLHGSWGAYLLMMAGHWLMATAVAAVTLLTSVWIDDYAAGVKLWLGVSVGLFFLDYVMRATDMSRLARAFIPFSYINSTDIIATRSIPLADAAILAIVAIGGIALTIPAFERKQITL